MSQANTVKSTPIVLVTGHPGTGKTTLAHVLADELSLPLFYKDGIKETLMNILGGSPTEWSRQLSIATWHLLYHHVEALLKAGVSHVVEGNFDPQFATAHWQNLADKYPLHLIQIRCETHPDILLDRYRQRIQNGERHTGHADQSHEKWFIQMLQQPMGWIDVESDRIPVDTTILPIEDYPQIAQQIRRLSIFSET